MNTRNLNFQNLNDVEEELNKLVNVNVRTTCLWTFFQILEYCRKEIEHSIKGYPQYGILSFFSRKLFGTIRLHSIIKKSFVNGPNNMFVPKERLEGNEKEAMEQLKEAIQSFRSYKGKMAVHPKLNIMDKTNYEKYLSILISNYLEYVFIVEGYDKDKRNEKVDKIKEELLKNINSKEEKKETVTSKEIPNNIEEIQTKLEPSNTDTNKDTIQETVEEKPEEPSETKTETTIEENTSKPEVVNIDEKQDIKPKTTTKKKSVVKKTQPKVNRSKKTTKKKVVAKKKSITKKTTVAKKKTTKKKVVKKK